MYGTQASKATFSGFKAYRKSDVNTQDYTKIVIDSIGEVWACLNADIQLDANKQATVKSPVVKILGHGTQPYIDFWGLPKESQRILVRHNLANS